MDVNRYAFVCYAVSNPQLTNEEAWDAWYRMAGEEAKKEWADRFVQVMGFLNRKTGDPTHMAQYFVIRNVNGKMRIDCYDETAKKLLLGHLFPDKDEYGRGLRFARSAHDINDMCAGEMCAGEEIVLLLKGDMVTPYAVEVIKRMEIP